MILYANYRTLMLLLSLTGAAISKECNRKLDGTSTPPSSLEGRFWITVAALNRTRIVDQYMPNVRYIVTIEAEKTSAIGPLKFTRFLLTAENKNDSLPAGNFDLADEVLTQFSDKCPSAVTERTKVPKDEASVYWTSPPEGSGCILIRAAVMETVETWYMDEGGLVRTVCQDPKAIEDDPGPILPECCACDEAKYEVTFEGLWSRNTHPKDFPSKGWLIRFSDVIGASHTVDYRFWQYGETASDGLQQVAEFGSTRKLESELKDQSENIRTIIKARGITYPNVTGRTFAVFRVDRKHHLMSLVSMIVPSPDWIVGVSGLELCLSNCSWIEHKELNLYPIDAGTDDGITYTSPDSPTDPREPITGITTFYPNDTRSPFYDPSGQDMKPMAKLHLNRQRLYEKICEDTIGQAGNTGGDTSEEPHKRHRNKACKTTDWGEWSECSATCSQLRQRSFRNPNVAMTNNCTELLTDRRPCPETDPPCTGGNGTRGLLDSPECELSEWSAWSPCTATCGTAYETRSRNFIYKKFRKYCRAEPRAPELQQTVLCDVEPCVDADFESKCPSETYHQWSNWAPCTSSCGQGVTVRSRQPIDDTYKGPEECKTQLVNCTALIISCDITKEDATEICKEPPIPGDCKGRYKRVYFNQTTMQCHFFDYSGCNGNRNNFQTTEECTKVCVNFERTEDAESELFNGIQPDSQVSKRMSGHDNGKRVDCRYTDWGHWSRCNGCRGYTFTSRKILVHARNGGTKCPTKLLRKKKCRKLADCSSQNARRRRRYRERKVESHHNESEHS